MVNTVANTKPLAHSAPKAVQAFESNCSVPKPSKEIETHDSMAEIQALESKSGDVSLQVMGIPQITTLKGFLEMHIS
jgi:hypothetical protein